MTQDRICQQVFADKLELWAFEEDKNDEVFLFSGISCFQSSSCSYIQI